MRELAVQLSFLPYRYFSGLFRHLDIPLSLLMMTFLRLKKPLRFGRDIFPLNYSIIKELLNYSLYQKELQRSLAGPLFFFHQWQLISLATKQERELLHASLSLGIPHEVCQVQVTTSSGEQKKSAVFHGGLFSFSVNAYFNNSIEQLLTREQEPISCLEIIHTHPSVDFILETHNDDSFLYLNGLSEADLLWAQKLSQKKSIKVKIKAVTHSELCYSVVFINGEPVKY